MRRNRCLNPRYFLQYEVLCNMSFADYRQLAEFLVAHGVTRAMFKPLSENDNTKQQIYLGGSFEAMNQLPFGDIRAGNPGGRANFKAAVELWWLNDDGNTAPAPRAQLILYPKYPEVHLSGFLQGAALAPREHLRPIPRSNRTGTDGRILIFGITNDNSVYAYLAPAGSPVAASILADRLTDHEASGVFYPLPLFRDADSKTLLLRRLGEIRRAGWHESCCLDRNGNIVPYHARNGGGYTLEALFGIIPNGRSEPDFMGWELKAVSKNRVTLMTPEPDSGYYGEQGVEAFVRRYGHDADNDTLYFTGIHKINARNVTTSMTMKLDGFDMETEKMIDPAGGILLFTGANEIAAKWSYQRLLEHWGRKHSQGLMSSMKGVDRHRLSIII